MTLIYVMLAALLALFVARATVSADRTVDTIISATFVAMIATIVLFVPVFLNLTIRRLHDQNWRAWWALFLLIPLGEYFIGYLIALRKGDDGPNRFGPASLE